MSKTGPVPGSLPHRPRLPRDESFLPNPGLDRAVRLLSEAEVSGWGGPSGGGFPMGETVQAQALPESLPDGGLGEADTLTLLAPHVLGRSARLDSPLALAHMDPPTPWLTWAMALWNARLNQNLLHPATSPFAREAEDTVIRWLAPFFGMGGGQMVSGSTLGNLTGLWAARDAAGVKRVVASTSAHVSIEKSARLLGLPLEVVPTDEEDRISRERLESLGDLSDTCLVLIGGTTGTGAVDPVSLAGRAAWTHVDAAWGGPLRLSSIHANLLDGIEKADSVAVSGHKWLFQPKDSALVFFRQPEAAVEALSFGASYLAKPNVGVQGSRGAAAVPLLATLMAWGLQGIAERIEGTMAMAETLADAMESDPRLQLWRRPVTGITVFRPHGGTVQEMAARLPSGMLSTCSLDGEIWLRSVAANPMADVGAILDVLLGALE